MNQKLLKSDGKLDLQKISYLLKINNEYPSQYRNLIWKSLLKIPECYSGYCSLVEHGRICLTQEMKEKFKSPTKFEKSLLRVLSAVYSWSSSYRDLDTITTVISPFVELFENTPHVGFEICISILINWFDCWLDDDLESQSTVFDVIDNYLKVIDNHLYSHVKKFHSCFRRFIKTFIRSHFNHTFHKEDWLKCWDHILSNHPSFFLSFVTAYFIVNKAIMMRCLNFDDMMELLSSKNRANSIIKEAYRIKKAIPTRPICCYCHFKILPRSYSHGKILIPNRKFHCLNEMQQEILMEEMEYISSSLSSNVERKRRNSVLEDMLSASKTKLLNEYIAQK